MLVVWIGGKDGQKREVKTEVRVLLPTPTSPNLANPDLSPENLLTAAEAQGSKLACEGEAPPPPTLPCDAPSV